jgi:hypothetical protein
LRVRLYITFSAWFRLLWRLHRVVTLIESKVVHFHNCLFLLLITRILAY